MNPQYLLFVGFVSVFLLSLAIGAWSRRRERGTLIDFFWGSNEFTVSQGTHLNLSTSFSINGILYSAWLGYKAGWASVIPQVIWCCGFLVLAHYSNRMTHLSRNGTLHGIIGKTFGVRAGEWAAVASVLGYVLLFGWELFIGATVIRTFTPTHSLAVEALVYFSLAGLAAFYCTLGGLRGNLRANEFQNYVSGVAAVVAIVYLGWFADGTRRFSWSDCIDTSTFRSLADELTWPGIVTNVILFLVYQFLDMSVWQNIASVSEKNREGTRRTLWLSAFWILIFPGVVGSALGMVMRSYENGITADTLMPTILQKASEQPVVFVLLVAGFIAMMLSTVDGLLLAACQALSWDLVDRKRVAVILRRRETDSRQKQSESQSDRTHPEDEATVLDRAKYGIVCLALVGGGITLFLVKRFGVNSFNLLYVTYVAQMALFPSIWVIVRGESRFRPRGALSISLGFLTGFATVVYGLAVGSTATMWAPVVAIAVASAVAWPFGRVVESSGEQRQ